VLGWGDGLVRWHVGMGAITSLIPGSCGRHHPGVLADAMALWEP